MKKDLFPLSPVPLKTAIKLSKILNFFANVFVHTNKDFKKELMQADISLDIRTYYSVSLFSAMIFFFMTFIPIFAIGLFVLPFVEILIAAFIFSFLMANVLFFYYLVYPKLLLFRKSRLLEKDLLFAMKYILIRIRAGIPLYDAMVGIAHGGYGEVSREFKRAVKDMSGGITEIKALENMALRTSSIFFRRTIWQIANNLRSGADIDDSLSSIINNLVKEQKIMIRRYGSELNPIILLYMMFSIVIPSLGITVVVVMSAFSGITVPISLFYLIPIGVLILQLIFISVIKNKRPLLSIGA